MTKSPSKPRKTATLSMATAIALGGIATPLINTPVHAAEVAGTEIPVNVSSVSLNKNGLQNSDDLLQSNERITPSVTFKPTTTPKEGDYSIITLSDGYTPVVGGQLSATLSDGTVVGVVTKNDNDSWKVTYTADVAKYDPNSLVITFAASIGPDISDEITFNTTPYEVAVGGVGTGESWKIEGRNDVTSSYPVIYPFLDATTKKDSLGPAFVIYQGDHAGPVSEATVSLKPQIDRWGFDTSIDPSKLIVAARQDTNTVDGTVWQDAFTGKYEIVKFTEDELIVKLTNIPEGEHVRIQLANGAGVPKVLDDQNYGYTMNLTIGDKNISKVAATKLLSAEANADAAKSAPTATFVAYGNDTAGAGTTADGQDSDANTSEGIATLEKTATNTLVATNTNKVIEENLILVNADTGEELKRFDAVKPGEKVAFDVSGLQLSAGQNTFNYKLVAENARNPELKIELTDPVNYTVYEKQAASIDVEATLNGEDADTQEEAVVVTPGTHKVAGTLTNNGSYALNSQNTTLTYEVTTGEDGATQKVEVVNLPEGFSVAPGETVNLADFDITINPQSGSNATLKASTSYTNVLPEVLGGNEVVSSEDADAVFAKALTTEIDLNDDSSETEIGHNLEFEIVSNDTASDETHPIDPATIKVTTTSKGVISEDGKTITNEGQWVVTITPEGKGLVEWAEGATDKELPTFTYTATNDLGDKTDDAKVTLVGYQNGISLESYLIDENGERIDADTEADAVKYTSTGEKKSVFVISNTGDKPLVDPELGYLDDNGQWVSVAVLTGVTIEPGATYEYDESVFDLSEGKWAKDFTVKANGVEASDAINAVVELPAPEPTPENTVEPKKNLEEKPQDSETKDTNTASNLFDRAEGGNVLLAILAALGAGFMLLQTSVRNKIIGVFKKS